MILWDEMKPTALDCTTENRGQIIATMLVQDWAIHILVLKHHFLAANEPILVEDEDHAPVL